MTDKIIEFSRDGIKLRLYFPDATRPGAGEKLVYLIGADGADNIRGLTGQDYTLAAVGCGDWNALLSPWRAPEIFRGGGDFSGGAPDHLRLLTGEIIPEAERILSERGLRFTPETRGIAGYSLAGLFSLWTAFNCDLFGLIASVSGSLWFDGFDRYIEANEPRVPLRRVYISVGDREERTKDPRMRTVRERSAAAAERFRSLGADTVFVLNRGGHFDKVDERLARGISGIICPE